MKFAYNFSNFLGKVYRHGNLTFTLDGNSLISPVGNRITVFDLKNNKSEILPLASQYNVSCVGLSPDGNIAILVYEKGAALLVSLISKSVIHQFHFHKPVPRVRFSTNGKKFVATKDKVVMMYHAPGKKRGFNQFGLDTTYYGAYDETTCIDWD